ncbi:ABC transporter permease [Saccharopolyspora sp. CA-218241]|uniref:ABC transporter permease n=1 Tax=Saccharopolyspora sp. CA-218241 TaxID=3240027 RepID=UPI003D98524C
MAEPVEAVRPGPRAWGLLIATEAKLVLRDTAGIVVPLGLPVLLMVMNGLGSDGAGIPELGGLPAFDAVVVPMTMAMVLAMTGVVNMPSFLATYRRTGVLRRLSVTPAHPWMVLAAQVVVGVAQSLIGIGLALVVARLGFGLAAPRSPLGAVAAFALVVVAMYALGMLVAAVSPTPNSAVAIGLVAFFAIFATGGGFGGRQHLPEWLAAVGAHLPFGAGMDVLTACWTGVVPDAGQLIALAVSAALSGIAAAALFRWT